MYIIFSISLFIFFNNFYVKSTKNEFINENKSAVSVFEKLMKEELGRLYLETKIFANDSIIYNAFISKIYIDISRPSTENAKDDFNIIKTSKMTGYKYIKLANRIKNQIGTNFGSKIEKEVGFFNEKGDLIGYTSEFKKELKKAELKDYILECIEKKEDGFTVIKRFEDGYILQAAYKVGQSNVGGFIVISKKLENVYIEEIKGILNREVIFLDVEGKIINSSIFFDLKRIKGEKVNLENSNIELKVGKEKINFNLLPLLSTSNELMGYIGTGFYLKEMEQLSFRSIKKFIPYEISFSIILFIILYFIIKSLFEPFNLILKGIKEIKEGKYESLIKINSSEELNMLGNSINELALSLQNRERKLLSLNKEIEETQREVLLTLGSIAETRSKETSNHVKRVSEYSRMLAIKYGVNEKKADLIKEASTMHDIGKIAIPDSILNKKGKLDEEEFEVIKSHCEIGFQMLNKSNREILKLAAKISLEHHEKWDGTGYPKALKGEEISIEGRIAAIADVFDALGSDRVYKKAWTLDKILDYFQSQRGLQFDPKLVDVFFENFDEFIRIRKRYKDIIDIKAAI